MNITINTQGKVRTTTAEHIKLFDAIMNRFFLTSTEDENFIARRNVFNNDSEYKKLISLVNEGKYEEGKHDEGLFSLLQLGMSLRIAPTNQFQSLPSFTSILGKISTTKRNELNVVPGLKLFLEDVFNFFNVRNDDAFRNINSNFDQTQKLRFSRAGVRHWKTRNAKGFERIDYYFTNLHDLAVECFKAKENKNFDKLADISNSITVYQHPRAGNLRYIFPLEYEFQMLMSKLKPEDVVKIAIMLLCNACITLSVKK